MLVEVMSKKNFEDKMRMEGITDLNVEDRCKSGLFAPPKMYLISINNSHGSDNRSYFRHDHKNVIRLFFDDLEAHDPILQNEEARLRLKLFDMGQAKRIVEFAKQFDNDSQVTVHCLAGVSRSGAVGTFLASRFHVPEENFVHEKDLYPNRLVMTLLNEAWGRMNV
jgi:predicted protein tyrosine phosphatase